MFCQITTGHASKYDFDALASRTSLGAAQKKFGSRLEMRDVWVGIE